jgi:hypothetical protein
MPADNAPACVYTIVESTKMSGINPPAYLTDVLRRIADHPQNRRPASLALDTMSKSGVAMYHQCRGRRPTLTLIALIRT